VNVDESVYVTELGWNATSGYFFHFRQEAIWDCSAPRAPGEVMVATDCTAPRYEGGILQHILDKGGRHRKYFDARWLHIFSGSLTNPTFLCSFDGTKGAPGSSECPPDAGSSWRKTECVSSRNNYFTALPPGLTAGVDAISLEPKPGWTYNAAVGASGAAIVVGTKAQLRRAIADSNNWIERPVGNHLANIPFYALNEAETR
jgi:hypothetical protein